MQIQAISPISCKSTTFGGNNRKTWEDAPTYDYYRGFDEGSTIGRKSGSLAGIVLGATLGLLSGLVVSKSADEVKTEALLDKIEMEYRDPSTSKNGFTIRDVNLDGVPEIVLHKKGGSEIAFDILNDKVLDGKTSKKDTLSIYEQVLKH